MKIISKCQKSTAVYWAPLKSGGVVQTDDYGTIRFKPPVQITCRKDDEERQVIKEDGTTVLSMAQYITEIAVEVGGILLEGELSKVATPTRPREIKGAREIISVMNTPTLNYRKTLHEAYV